MFRLLSRRWLNVSTRTVVDPALTYEVLPPSNFSPKSLLIFSTPQNLQNAIYDAIDATKKDVQVVVAGVDTVPGNYRNGVSSMWLDEPMALGKYQFLDPPPQTHTHTHGGKPCDGHSHSHQPQHTHTHGGEPCDGDHGKVPGKNWSHLDALLSLNIGTIHADVLLANTLFATNYQSTLFFFEKGNPDNGKVLKELEVTLPFKKTTKQVSDRWEPLFDEHKFEVTGAAGNLLKSLDGKLAAGLLQDNDRVMTAGKELEVYVKLWPKDGGVQRFKCIASGGAWGAKKDIVALNPDATPQKGDKLLFFLLPPEAQIDEPTNPDHFGVVAFECLSEQHHYESQGCNETTIEHVFGCGSEKGFIVNGVRHELAGERVIVDTTEGPSN